MTSIQSLTSFKLDLPPSCIEFFPLNPQYAIIGTYNLEKSDEKESAGSAPHDGKVSAKNQQRNGSLILVRVDGDIVYVGLFADYLYLLRVSRRSTNLEQPHRPDAVHTIGYPGHTFLDACH